MASKRSKCLVIDADVARSCGTEEATHLVARKCREFLDGVREICHRVVMTSEISTEWRSHASRYARTWRVSMEARKKVIRVPVYPDSCLRAGLEANAPNEAGLAAMLKDLHLLQAAMATDGIVVSRDDNARVLFRNAAGEVRAIRGIVWVNPVGEADPRLWLANGAEPDLERTLSGSGMASSASPLQGHRDALP